MRNEFSRNTSRDSVDDKIDQWHTGEIAGSLSDYLGMTAEEYALWVENGSDE